jgi:hypothetical protein
VNAVVKGQDIVWERETEESECAPARVARVVEAGVGDFEVGTET